MSKIAMNRDLQIEYVTNLLHAPLWSMKMHRHEHQNELLVVTRGKERVLTDSGEEIIINTGDAILFPQGRGHEEYNHTKSKLKTLYLSFTGNFGSEFTVVHDHGSRLRNLTQQLFSLNHVQSPLVDDLRQSYFMTVIGEFLLLAQNTDTDILVTQIRDYIQQNLAKPIQVDVLAKIAFMSKYYFIRKHKSLSGITPMQEVRQMRLREARNLIASTHLPLKQIACMVGFSDEYIFSKNFKKLFGSTPGSYKKR